MSRKKIVAATMIAAALGLAFAGYTATRANGTDEVPEPLRAFPLKADAGYRQNHQIGHDGAVFEWMDATASLNQTPDNLRDGDTPVGHDPATSETEDGALPPVAIEHATRIGPDTFAGFGLAGGAGGGTPKGTDEWAGGRYGGSFGGYGGFGGITGAGTPTNTKGSSGTNDPSSDTPHTDAPALTNNGTGDEPGTNDPTAGDPPATGPAHQDPENENPDNQTPGGPDGGQGGGSGEGPRGEYPPTQGSGGEPHSVPEPATLGLLGFGMIAAAALRRRRRN